MSTKQLKTILVLEPGFRSFKESILKSMKRVNKRFKIVVASGLEEKIPADWAKKYSAGWIQFSYEKKDFLLKIKNYQTKNNMKFSGVVTYVDPAVCLANEIQQRLSLPQISKIVGRHLKNKGLMRQLFAKVGVSQPQFFIVPNLHTMPIKELWSLDFPLVMKPTEMMSSLGVFKVNSYEEILKNFKSTSEADFWEESLRSFYSEMDGSVLFEEYIAGPMYSVEAFIQNGIPRIIGITGKTKMPHSSKYFTESGHYFPARISASLFKKIKSLIEVSHMALQLENCVTHTEIKVRSDIPYLIELNPRLAGGNISSLIEKSTDCNVGEILLQLACGEATLTKFKPLSRAVIKFASIAEEGRLVEIRKFKSPPGTEVQMLATVNDLIDRRGLVGRTRVAYMRGQKVSQKDINELEKCFIIEPKIEIPTSHPNEYLVIRVSVKSLNQVCAIEKRAWHHFNQQAGPNTLKKRLKNTKNITLMAINPVTKQPLGFLTATELPRKFTLEKRSWTFFAKCAVGQEKIVLGKTLNGPRAYYVVSISVPPSAPSGIGALLLEGLKSAARHKKIFHIAYGARPTGLSRYMNPDEYLADAISGKVHAPSLYIGQKTGGKINGLIKNYFKDPNANNYGVLITYDLKRK